MGTTLLKIDVASSWRRSEYQLFALVWEKKHEVEFGLSQPTLGGTISYHKCFFQRVDVSLL